MKSHKKIAASIVLAVSMCIVTLFSVFADEVTDLQGQKQDAQKELDALKEELAQVMVEIDDLELLLAEVYEDMGQTNEKLETAQKLQDEQYETMKLRIKYMYENGGPSILEEYMAGNDIHEVLNRSEYSAKVYEYDRKKLEQMADTTRSIKEMQQHLLAQKGQYEGMEKELAGKQEELSRKISDIAGKIDDYEEAIAKAAAKAASASSNKNGNSAGQTLRPQLPEYNYSQGDVSLGNAIAAAAQGYIGTPYASGGASPAGFDCSGFTSYIFGQFGIPLSRSSGAQIYGGVAVSGFDEALPGDIICYAGHVAIYIGDGMMVHASVPGSYVRYDPADLYGSLPILAIRRYW